MAFQSTSHNAVHQESWSHQNLYHSEIVIVPRAKSTSSILAYYRKARAVGLERVDSLGIIGLTNLVLEKSDYKWRITTCLYAPHQYEAIAQQARRQPAPHVVAAIRLPVISYSPSSYSPSYFSSGSSGGGGAASAGLAAGVKPAGRERFICGVHTCRGADAHACPRKHREDERHFPTFGTSFFARMGRRQGAAKELLDLLGSLPCLGLVQ